MSVLPEAINAAHFDASQVAPLVRPTESLIVHCGSQIDSLIAAYTAAKPFQHAQVPKTQRCGQG